MNVNEPVTSIKGVGEKTAELLTKIGVYTVGDILLSFPKSYVQYPKAITPEELHIQPGEAPMIALAVQIRKSPIAKKAKGMDLTILELQTGSGLLSVVWFRMPYIRKKLLPGRWYVLYGKLSWRPGKEGMSMEQPEIYEPESYENISERYLPVYGLTKGLSNHMVTKLVQTALAQETCLIERLPDEVRRNHHLCAYEYAIKQIHFPDDFDTLYEARKRLVFEEFFFFILGLQYRKEVRDKQPNHLTMTKDTWMEQVKKRLPYELTEAQKNSLEQMKKDITGEYLMQRLLQGDVGSGKTIIAFLCMVLCSENHYQSAIMAPTEVLAMQHYDNFCQWVEEYHLPIPVVLLTGSMTQKQKREAYEKLQQLDNAIVVGTHALIQDKAVYGRLALVITDEQHRFGVKQRQELTEKGINPHVLVMSATPIPRTLAMILYGDLDISVMNEVPAKRLPIKNCVVNTTYRPKAYDFIRKEVALGHQAYVICPLVEETENMDSENIKDYSKRLREELGPGIQVEFLHGKMKPKDKNAIMERFLRNEIQVLVSTTVIEVGVNVPNATVMMIENAERFGLAQLHQLRGRVGRGNAQSYCIMINTSGSKKSQKRLDILNHSNDGFYIASEDLKLRGPGDFFGIRQSGEMYFQMGDIYQDADVLQEASDAVREILDKDPELLLEEHRRLKEMMEQYTFRF